MSPKKDNLPHSDDRLQDSGEDSLEEIINIAEIQAVMDDFYHLTGMVTAVLDMSGKIIEQTGWQDLCTLFHRVNPFTAENCRESDLFLVENIKRGEYVDYRCKNGLVDVVTPLYIGEKHWGNIYTGQFFYDHDEVDEDFFLRQADKYGFDRTAYIEAFRRIPRYSREQIDHLMSFLVKFATYVSDVSFAKARSEKELLVRRRAEEDLARQKGRLDYIIQGMNVGTWEWNVQTGELILNERWANIMGYALNDLDPVTINTWLDYCHPDDLAESDRLLQLCFTRQEEFYDCECRMMHRDGHWVWVIDRGKVITWTDEGKPEWMFGTHLDITDRKRDEQERDKIREQLDQNRKMESVGRLAGGVAHDFNNMLGVILGHTELAAEEIKAGQTDSLEEHLEAIAYAAEHSADLTRQLLAYARKETVVPEVMDLNRSVGELLTMIHKIIGENIELIWLPGKGLPSVKIAPSQINQVLVNLCVNARDAIEGVGRITIESGTALFDEAYCREHIGYIPGDYVMLAVSDSGRGMEKETLSHIFEPFYTTKGVGQGTGLGLATVYGVIRQNGGFINVYSEPGMGTVIRVYLPALMGNAPAEGEKSPDDRDRGWGHERILLVEDSPEIRNLVARMLELKGYTVILASGPEEALREVREPHGKIELLLTDVVMPEMSGKALAEEVARLEPEIKCLFMSGYTANVIARQGILEERVNFVQKPFTSEILIRKVRNVLDGL
ncbi:MAG: PocR ligand-binding domain-containing protein [Spirochaetales bacterium]|nr:PocR ligand-binding domain-containing protein [Spirochaetales bacterium]